MASESASPTFMLLRRSVSAKSVFVLFQVRNFVFVLHGTRLFFNHIMYFVFPKILYFLKINFYASYAFEGDFISSLLVFRRLSQKVGHFRLKMCSDVRDGFTGTY